jgi:hypothetical protein
MMRRGIAPAALVTAVVVIGWLVTGVAALDIIKFLAYDAAFVALPGIALLWALRGHRSALLTTIALGWPLGQALEMLAFTGTAEIGARWLFLLYPVVVIVPSAYVVRRRQTQPDDDIDADPESGSERWSTAVMWTAAGALSLALIYLTLEFLPLAPLPGSSVIVEYPDYPYFIGLITQVMNHWPPTTPGLSGVPLAYEWFVLFHIAAASQVTHIPVPIIGLRLDYVPTIVVVGCQLLAVGRYVGRSAWTGVIALGLLFLMGPPDLTSSYSGSPDGVFVHLWDSWTFPFGLTFMLALLYLITERLRASPERQRGDLRAWALITILMIGASGAKATILPDITVGAAIYIAFHVLMRRRVPASVVITLILGIVVFVPTYIIVYGGQTPGTKIELLAWLAGSTPVIFANLIHHTAIRDLVLPFAYAAGFALVMAPLAGVLYLLRRRHRGEIHAFAFPICMFAAGVLIAASVHHSSGSELYFQDTGYVAACIVGAEGLRRAWLDLGRSVPVSRSAVALAFAGWVVLILVIVRLTSHSVDTPGRIMLRYIGVVILGVAFVAACAVVVRRRYGSSNGIVALGLIPIMAASIVTTPLAVYPNVQKVLADEPLTSTQIALKPPLLAALYWLRDHSSVNDVFAVNNHWINPEHTSAKYYYYTAFSQRQAFIEAYNPYPIPPGPGTPAGANFIYRMQLNDEVFNRADPSALKILTEEYGVRFLFIDRTMGPFLSAVLGLGHLVFSNQDADIVAVG